MEFRIDLFAPELFQLALILVLFVQTLGGESKEGETPLSGKTSWLGPVSCLGIVVSGLCLGKSGLIFFEAYRIDGLSQFFKLAVSAGFAIAVLNAARQPELETEKRADYFLLLSLSALGLMLLASSVELITAYLALEVSSYSLYALIPLRRKDPKAAEAAVKYILFGAAATAVSLFGLSYIVAVQHSTYMAVLMTKTWTLAQTPLAVAGLTLFMVGFFYKLALFPFHFWAPDVYEGASNETAAYAATLPKLGAAVILIRLSAMFISGPQAGIILAVFGAISMTLGNLMALTQKDLKRMLGYSSVAHAGYIMIGLVSGTAEGLAAAGFYSLIYILMNLTVFWVISRLSSDGRNLKYDDLNGLHAKAPGLAFILAVGAFALVGLPPTAGFIGKLFLLTSTWGKGYDWLIVVAALNTAISIYYYLNLVRHAYTADSTESPESAVAPGGALIGGLLAALLLLIGVMPAAVFNIALAAGKQLLP